MNTIELTSESQSLNASGNSTWRDWVGIVASIACAIHCAAMPFVIAYLPALGLGFLADESFHKWMALVCFLIAMAAFVPGFRRHRNWIPISVGAFGLVFITFAAFGLAGECCPSCEAATVANASTPVDGETAAIACDQCEHCQSCETSSDLKVSTTQVAAVVDTPANQAGPQKDLLASLAPWITPFGGFLLVTAHLLNRRYGSICKCCAA
ncbi:MAG: MerC domain-containing protein [Planctomycetota bacterium]